MSDELLPCPFCGGRPKLMKEQIEGHLGYPCNYVGCTSCLCIGPLGGSGILGEQLAVSKWNESARPNLKVQLTAMNDKVMCCEWRCKWHGTYDQCLSAKHPFQEGEDVYGCPKCKEIGTLREACDETNCWSMATCGWTDTPGVPGANYRRLCGPHFQKLSAKNI